MINCKSNYRILILKSKFITFGNPFSLNCLITCACICDWWCCCCCCWSQYLFAFIHRLYDDGIDDDDDDVELALLDDAAEDGRWSIWTLNNDDVEIVEVDVDVDDVRVVANGCNELRICCNAFLVYDLSFNIEEFIKCGCCTYEWWLLYDNKFDDDDTDFDFVFGLLLLLSIRWRSEGWLDDDDDNVDVDVDDPW